MTSAKNNYQEEKENDFQTQFVAQEQREKGGFSAQFYARYVSLLPYFFLVAPLLLLATAFDMMFVNGFKWLVALRFDDCGLSKCEVNFSTLADLAQKIRFMSDSSFLYFLLFFVVLGVFVRAVSWFLNLAYLANGGRRLHNEIVRTLGAAPVAFFDENPTGRLIKRFSGDYAQVKNEIPNYLSDILASLVEIVWVAVIVLFQAPIAGMACVPCGVMYFNLQRRFRPASREIQRLKHILESPIWNIFNESLVGFQTIRAYGRAEIFEKQLAINVLKALYAAVLQSRFTRWLNVRLKLISELFSLAVALFICFSCAWGNMGVGTAGFLLSLTIGLDMTMQWMTRTLSLLEGTLVSAERMLEYRNIPPEESQALAHVHEPEKLPADFFSVPRNIVFQNVVVSYRSHLPNVLKGLSVVFPAGSRVGIVGKTGAGKSTIFQALYRMVYNVSGQIMLANVNLADLPLAKARSLFAIVPQEPYMFEGSLRENLDRLGERKDEEIWHMLRLASLEQFVRQLPDGLQSSVLERGANFSLGQRQLFCLVRSALLGRPYVFLDEPTSSVDPQTDELITAAAKIIFQGSTQLVIAHRLSTVLECDQVILIEDGKLRMIGKPAEVTEYFRNIGHEKWEDVLA